MVKQKYMNISFALREARVSAGFKQIEFGKLANLSQTYISQIENGKKTPSVEVIQKYSDLTKLPLAIVLWKSITEKDVHRNKKIVFKELKPVIDNLINQIFYQ